VGTYGGKTLEVVAIQLIPSIGAIINLLTVAIGLGLVIFFHELGHFAVAKWCGVNVERFSIGFGKILWSFKRGETEYALSMIPFGGYVKMLGQDDADPSKMTDEEVTSDPRSYPAKTVPQRMAIISAGVIMNLITGMLFFAIAFLMGVEFPDRVVQSTQPGMPAWEYGIRAGDTITSINGSPVADYNDIRMKTALSTGNMQIEAMRPNGEIYKVTFAPDTSGRYRRIGIAATDSLMVAHSPSDDSVPVAIPGTVAAALESGFQSGDTIVAIDGIEITTHAELMDHLARHRDESVEFEVSSLATEETPSTRRTISVPPEPFRDLGIRFGNGKIVAIQRVCPAATPDAEGDRIQVGDRIVKINGESVGLGIDPLKLPDHFAELAGQDVVVTVAREQGGGPPGEVDVTLKPDDRPGWTEQPFSEETPLSIPAIGVAFEVLPSVLDATEGGPAADAGIQDRETIAAMTLTRPESIPESKYLADKIEVEVGESGIPYVFWLIQQQYPAWDITLSVKAADSEEVRSVSLDPRPATDWNLPTTRGLLLNSSMIERKGDSFPAALAMGLDYTGDTVIQIYLTLRSLFTGDLSILNLSGPIGIAQIAWTTASYGFADFLMFLGMISVNLAVINFLPIPVLDGGHMVFLIWEGVTRRKPSEAVFRWATNLGLLFVMGLLITVIYIDLFVPKE
jgi:regulator of sigma E protease